MDVNWAGLGSPHRLSGGVRCEGKGGGEGEGPEHVQPIGFGQVWPALF